jgi:putative membrane protein (TIGR04086 family)
MSSAISGICAGLGCFTAGFISSKKIKSSGLINGGVCGVIIYLFILFISLFVSDKGFSLITLIHSVIAVISSLAGGVLGVNSASKRRF